MGYREIPESVLLQSNIPVVLEKFRKKALSYSLIRDAYLEFESVKGARVSADRFLFNTLGKVSVDLAGMPSLVVRFSGTGEYKREEHRIYLIGFKILNDVAGFGNKLVDVIGIGEGRSVHVTQHDDELILSLFPEASAQ